MVTKLVNHSYVIRPQGRLDIHGGAVLQQEITAIAPANHPLWVIDMEAIDFIDTSGLVSLISGLNLSRQHHSRLVLCNLQATVRLVFEITQLDRVFEIFDSYDNLISTQCEANKLALVAA